MAAVSSAAALWVDNDIFNTILTPWIPKNNCCERERLPHGSRSRNHAIYVIADCMEGGNSIE